MNSGWQLASDAPTSYTRFGHKIMEPWADNPIRSTGCRDGDRVLDVACGTGIVANQISLVSGKLCSITGIDFNGGMLSVARRNTQVESHQGSVADMPFDPGSFEVVLCQQGLQYFPDRATAVSEMARVLSPGGRLAHNGEVRSIEAVPRGGNCRRGQISRRRSRSRLRLGVPFKHHRRATASRPGCWSERHSGAVEHRTLGYPVSAGMVIGFMGATPVTTQFAALSSRPATCRRCRAGGSGREPLPDGA